MQAQKVDPDVWEAILLDLTFEANRYITEGYTPLGIDAIATLHTLDEISWPLAD